MRNEALGMIETRGWISLIVVTDTMAKATNVAVIGVQKIGSGLVTIMVRGDVERILLSSFVDNNEQRFIKIKYHLGCYKSSDV